jgi:hypothetical protein
MNQFGDPQDIRFRLRMAAETRTQFEIERQKQDWGVMETLIKDSFIRIVLDRLFGRFTASAEGIFRRSQRSKPRLALLERVSLAPRQSLALVEAEGRKFLVATSHETGTTFYALGDVPRSPVARAKRVSW